MKHLLKLAIFLGFFSAFSLNASQIIIWEQMEPNALQEFRKIVSQYNKENPKSKVILKHYSTEDLRTNFQTASLANSGPDIVYGPDDMVGLFVTAGLLAPLDEVFPNKFYEKTFYKDALNSTKYQGKTYGLPDMQGNHIALLYNKKFVANAPKDFNEFISSAKKHQVVAKSRSQSTYGLVFNIKEPFWFVGFYNGFGGSVFDSAGKVSLNNEAMVKALTFVKDIETKHNLGVRGMDYNVSHQLFSQGKAAYILQGSWAWGEYEKAGIDFGVTYLPLENGKNAKFYSSTKTFLFSNKEASLAKKEHVEKFMQYVFDNKQYENYVMKQGIIPTTNSLRQSSKVNSAKLTKMGKDALNYTTPMPNSPQMRAVWDGIRPSLEAVLEGKLEPKQAAERMQRDAERLVKTILN